MTYYRQYENEPLRGEPAPFNTVAQRRKLVGRRIGWHVPGWGHAKYGVVEEVSWKNVLVSGNWEWAPNMRNVHVLPEEEKPE